MGAVALKRVSGVAKASMILVAVATAAAFFTLLASQAIETDAEAYLAGSMSKSDFTDAMATYVLVSSLQGVATIASAVLVIIWMYRLAANHRTLHRGGTWAPIWAVFGWILPPLLYIIPFLMLRELYKASDPTVPVGGDWKSSRVSPMVTLWFIAYSIIPLLLVATTATDAVDALDSSETAIAEQITGDQTWNYVAILVTVAGAVTFITMARDITARHRQLTGEQRP